MPGLAPAPEPPARSAPSSEPFAEVNLIDQLLADQNKLQTPVAQFAEAHEADRIPARTELYRHLIPLEAPRRGERYAFEVELDKCTGCKACVTACHSLNGLDDSESWRDIGLLEDQVGAYQQTVTTACHHCDSPECLHGCPVAAYEQDEATGIVRHLDDQCIGCEYCILKCPYDAPKYSKARGIVRKCDMCHQRLAVGEAPACVQACPTEAIRIVAIERGEPNTNFLPLAPDPALTLPTTRFVGRNVPATARPADQSELKPQPAHWPLVFMLVLTQAGLGLFAATAFAGPFSLRALGVALFFGGLASSILHLGRPLGAWRFFLGLRTSWLSREILAFNLAAPLFALSLLPLGTFQSIAAGAAIALGLASVLTSVMVYHDTRRPSWQLSTTSARFFGTTLSAFLLGGALVGWCSPILFALIMGARLAWELSSLRATWDRHWSPARHSARIQVGPLRFVFLQRMVLGAGAAMLSPFWLPGAVLLFLAGELAERALFFRAVHAPKMPGPAA